MSIEWAQPCHCGQVSQGKETPCLNHCQLLALECNSARMSLTVFQGFKRYDLKCIYIQAITTLYTQLYTAIHSLKESRVTLSAVSRDGFVFLNQITAGHM